MKGLLLYYNTSCPICTKRANRTKAIDWLGRITLCTNTFPIGEVAIGVFVVVNERTNQVFTGIESTREICLRIPVLFLYVLVLCLPSVRRLVAGSEQGSGGS